MSKVKIKTILFLKNDKHLGRELREGVCYSLPTSVCENFVKSGAATFEINPIKKKTETKKVK